jgi:hypothetical protein
MKYFSIYIIIRFMKPNNFQIKIGIIGILFLFILFDSGYNADGKSSPGELAYFKTSKPFTRWWWFASVIKKEDIAYQLDWVKKNNFGGVEIAWVYPLNIKRYARFYPGISAAEREKRTPRQEWLSPQWSEIAAFAKQYADQIGLGCDFTFGTAWPFGDSQVLKPDAAKIYGDPSFLQKNIISWEYPDEGLVIDHLDRGALERYALRLGRALAQALKGSPSALFCDSWEVETRFLWTTGFDRAFRQKFGYDISPYMNDIYKNGSADPRYDYMKLLSEYIIREFYQPYTRICHRLGGFSRVQCSGSPTDIITAYASVDIPESEALLYEPAYSRIVASAACLGSKKIITCETFTCLYGWPREYHRREQTADLKLVADAVFANGVNHIIWHGMPFNPRGVDNIDFYAAVHVGAAGALADELPAFNRYMETVSAIMKKGKPYADVAVYLPLEDSWMAGEYPEELQLPWAWGQYELRYVRFPDELNGYQPLWINHYFLKKSKVKEGKLYCGDAVFSLLYLDVDYLDAEALDTILKLAKKGLPICLKKTPKQPGKVKSPVYQVKMEELKKLKNVADGFGKLGVKVDKLLEPIGIGEVLPDFWCRELEGVYYIFIAHPQAQNLHLPLSYGQSYTDEVIEKPVKITIKGKTQPVSLRFAPYQSLLLKVEKGAVEFIDITFTPRKPVTDSAAPGGQGGLFL